MPKLLYMWEYGSDLGHVNNFLPIAERLLELGWTIAATYPSGGVNPDGIKRMMSHLGAEFWVSPGESVVLTPTDSSKSHVDMLSSLTGLRSGNEVGMFLDSWLEIIRSVQPDMVLCDYSVIGPIAAKITGVPVIVLDQGWFVPDLKNPVLARPFMSELESGRGVDEVEHRKDVAAKQQALLNMVNEQLKQRNFPKLACYGELYSGDLLILNNYPSLSTLPIEDKSVFVGSFEQANCFREVDWPMNDKHRPHVFVYLKYSTSGLLEILDALVEEGMFSVIAYVSSAPKHILERYQSESIHMSDSPVNVPKLLSSADLVVSNAGMGLICQSMLAGIPMALAPQWNEQCLNALRVSQLKAGLVLEEPRTKISVKAALERLLSDYRYLASASQFSLHHQPANVAAVTKRITELLVPNQNMYRPESASDSFSTLAELDWFYITDNCSLKADSTWELLQQHTQRVIAITEADYWCAVRKAAQQTRTSRFVTVKQGCIPAKSMFQERVTCPKRKLHSHWYWTALEPRTGLVHLSSNIVCWSSQALVRYGDSYHSVPGHEEGFIFQRRCEFGQFAKVASEDSDLLDDISSFYRGYRTSLNLIDAFNGQENQLKSAYASIPIRRLFLHMSSSHANVAECLHTIGARLAFVNIFIRIRRNAWSITKHNAEEYFVEAQAYSRVTNFETARGKFDKSTMLQLIRFSKRLGSKVRSYYSKPPIVDMNVDASAILKQSLKDNRSPASLLYIGNPGKVL